MPVSEFEIQRKLGAGAFGTVFKVRRRTDSKIYAMKRVDISHMSKREMADALTEVRILASVRHKNVVSFLEAFVEGSRELVMVLDYCDGGDLHQQIEAYRKARRYMSEARIWSYGIQLVDGLGCLHGLKIVHRDLKPANAFLTAAGEVRIGDLNVSKIAKPGQQMKTQIGTPYYMAPEIWADQPYADSCDLWALGCVLYELAALKPPFNARSIAGLGRAVKAGTFAPISRSFSADLHGLVAQLLRVKPALRPSCKALAASKVFADRRKDRFDDSSEDDDDDDDDGEDKVDLLKTIKVPPSVHQLTNALPKSCYPDTRPNSPTAWPATNTERSRAISSSRASSSSARSSSTETNSNNNTNTRATSSSSDGAAASSSSSSSSSAKQKKKPVAPRRRSVDINPRRPSAIRLAAHAEEAEPPRFNDLFRDPKKSPLPIKGGHVNKLLRDANREVHARHHAADDKVGDAARDYHVAAQEHRRKANNQDAAIYDAYGKGHPPPNNDRWNPHVYAPPRQPDDQGGARRGWDRRDDDRRLPSVHPDDPAAKIQAVLRGSRTRKHLAAREEARRRAAAAGANHGAVARRRAHQPPDWWG